MKRLIIPALAVLTLSGCVTIPPTMALSDTFWTEKDKTVAIVIEKLPQADYMTLGQQGLLDLAINEGANSELNDYLHQLDMQEFLLIGEEFRSFIEAQGVSVVSVKTDYVLPELNPLEGGKGFALKNFKPLRDDLGADRLLLISVPHAGVVRQYYGFIATGAPMADFFAKGIVVDLDTNRVLWRARFDTKLAIAEPWDEPPSFPNVTSAFYKAMEKAGVQLKNDFRVVPAVAAPAAAAKP